MFVPREAWLEWFEGLQILVLGLQVLDNVILTRWKVLPREQCQGRSLCLVLTTTGG